MGYDLELDRAIEAIREKGARAVLLQLPEGLKTRATSIIKELESGTGASVILQLSPLFGACDPPRRDALEGVDLVVHVGHAPIPEIEPSMETVFIEAHSDLDVAGVVREATGMLDGRVGLVTTVQHVHKLDEMRAILEGSGLEVRVGQGDKRIAHPGQVLGCNFSSAMAVAGEVDTFLFVGTGRFHPVGVAIATGKRVLAADPSSRKVGDVDELRERILRQRHAAMARATMAQRFGVLVCTKVGQGRPALARQLKREIEASGRGAWLLSFDHLDPGFLSGIDVDCFVSTACPRIALDDQAMFDRPVLTPNELRVLIGNGDWDGYAFDEITEGSS